MFKVFCHLLINSDFGTFCQMLYVILVVRVSVLYTYNHKIQLVGDGHRNLIPCSIRVTETGTVSSQC